MDIGLVVAIIVAYLLGWWCLILPLFIAFVISSIWTLTYPKHNSIRASVKSWYLVVVARTKSFFRGNPPSLNAPIITVDKPVDNKVAPEQEGDVTVVSVDEEPKK
jgi:hypothetical protein